MITDEEERELMESSERGEWVSLTGYDFEREKALWEAAAREHLKPKRERISISIPKRDLEKLKVRAAEQGLPYQTLINSILHQYVESGR